MESLKPCPFCEGTKLDCSVKVSSRQYKEKSLWHAVIYCKDCHAYGRRVVCYSYSQYRPSEDELASFKNEAASAWNARGLERESVDLEAAVRALWNARANRDLGEYDDFKAEYPRDCEAHGVDLWKTAEMCANAWGLQWRKSPEEKP